MRIAIDVMGGDYAPDENVKGLKLALSDFPEIEKCLLVGKVDEIKTCLHQHELTDSDPRLQLIPASQVVEMTEPSSTALRAKKDSSITVASKLLKDGVADALVSAGHTLNGDFDVRHRCDCCINSRHSSNFNWSGTSGYRECISYTKRILCYVRYRR